MNPASFGQLTGPELDGVIARLQRTASSLEGASSVVAREMLRHYRSLLDEALAEQARRRATRAPQQKEEADDD